VVVAPSSAAKVAALSEAMRRGGSTASVPRAVDVEIAEVDVLEPHAARVKAAAAAAKPLKKLNMPVS
jgi:hypothetical protein